MNKRVKQPQRENFFLFFVDNRQIPAYIQILLRVKIGWDYPNFNET